MKIVKFVLRLNPRQFFDGRPHHVLKLRDTASLQDATEKLKLADDKIKAQTVVNQKNASLRHEHRPPQA